MARRIKTDKTNSDVEQALEQILETEFNENTDLIEEHNTIEIEDLKRKIDNYNASYDEPEINNEAINNSPEENQNFIKQLKAANDDKGFPSFSQIFSTRSSSKIYFGSFALSLLWLAGSTIIGYNLFKNSNENLQNFLSSNTGITFLFGTATPIALIWGFAKLMKNSKDLSMMIKSLVNTQFNNIDAPVKTNNLLQSNTTDVQNFDGDIQKTFDRACELETLVQGEVKNLERAYSENEDKLRKLIGMLANERQAILEHADRVKSTLQLTSSEISSELSGVTDKITVNIETIADRLSDSLNAKTQNMLDNLKAISGSLTGEFIEDIDEKGITYLDQLDIIFDRVKNGIEAKSQDSVNLFSNKLAEIGDAASLIVDEFNNKFDNMDTLLQNRGAESLNNFEEQLQTFTNIFNAIPERLDIATKKALVECEKNLLALDDILSDQSKSAITSFITYSISIEEHSEKLTNLLDSRVSEINNSIQTHINELSDTIDSGKNDLFSIADTTQNKVADKVKDIEANIELLFDNKTKILEEKFNDSNLYLANVINNESGNIAKSVQDRIDNISTYLNNIENSFIDKLNDINGDNEQQIEIVKQYNDSLTEQLKVGLNLLSQSIESYNQNIETKTHALQGDMDVSLNNMFSLQSDLIDDRIEKLRELIADKDAKFNAIFDTQIENYEQQIEKSNNSFSNEFSNHLSVLKDYAKDLQEAIAQTEGLQASLSEHLENSVQKSIDDLTIKTQNIGENLKVGITEASNILTQETNNAQEHINILNTTLKDSINNFEDNFTQVQENIIQGTQYIAENIKEKITDINENIKVETENTTKQMLQASDYVNSTFAHVSNEIEQRIQERSTYLNETSTQLYEQIDNQLNKVGTSINELMEYNDTHFMHQLNELNKTTDAVYNAAVTTNETINNTKEQITDQIVNTAEHLREHLSIENSNLLEVVAERSNEISRSLNKFNNDITNNIVTITEQLSESSQSIFNKTNDIISNIQQTENTIGINIDKFSQRSADISKGLGKSFQEHAELLTTAANLLNKAQSNFDGNINEKQQALNILANTLANKTDDILASIKYYENIVNNNFNNINQQAKHSLDNFSRELQFGLKEAIDKFNTTSNVLKATSKTINNELNNRNNLNYNNSDYINKGSETIKQAINNQAHALGNLASFMNTNTRQSSNNEFSLKSVAGDIVNSVNSAAFANMWRNYRKNAINIQPMTLYNSNGLMLVGKIKSEYDTNFSFRKAIDNYIAEFEQILQNVNLQQDPNAVFNALQTNGGIVYTVLANIVGRIS